MPAAASHPATPDEEAAVRALLAEIWTALGGSAAAPGRLQLTGNGDLPSVFAVSDLAAAAVGAAGLALSELVAAAGGPAPAVAVDRRLGSFWFASSVRPQGWSVPPPWDPIAGDYRAADGWIRLHTNAPAHRQAALAVLGVAGEKEEVTRAVAGWSAAALERAVVEAGGCAAEMRSLEAWAAHEQGRHVAAEALVAIEERDEAPALARPVDPARPLAGIRVLDLTRVLAGPVATRLLAGYGAEVLRIDPPGWDEPALAPEVLLGKRTARLDLARPEDHALFLRLMGEADILVHGYRPSALEGLGFGEAVRRQVRPGLIDICLDAYGWSGPWRERRGFDSLVQMSAGIAEAGMRRLGKERPTPLPVQALDHATGYLMAAAAVLGLVRRLATGRGSRARASLAATAALLARHPLARPTKPLATETPDDLDGAVEATGWGPAQRLRAPLAVAGASAVWPQPAMPIGSHQAAWIGGSS